MEGGGTEGVGSVEGVTDCEMVRMWGNWVSGVCGGCDGRGKGGNGGTE
jgi:hypothetical protein